MAALTSGARWGDEGLDAWLARPPVVLLSTDGTGVCTLLEGRIQVLGLSRRAVGDPLPEVFAGEPSVVGAFERALAGEVVSVAVEIGDGVCELRLFPRRDGGVDGVAVAGGKAGAEHGYDELTGLANRRLLFDRMRLALAHLGRRGGRVVVLAINLDRFGRLNEILGYRTGDLILVQLAAELAPMVRAGDTIARLGADKFALVCEDVATDHAVVALADRVKNAFGRPLSIAGRDVFLSASIGIALATSPATDPGTILGDAEAAMLESKRRGGGRWELFDPAIRVRARQELEIEQALRRALDGDEFSLHYQPIVDLATDRVVGVEALLRWDCPGLGYVPPLRFIPLAEEIGLIVPIGRWVLEEAGRMARRWAAEDPQSFSISVNVSAAQLNDDLLTVVHDVLRPGQAPCPLCLELTESAVMQDVDHAVEALGALKAAGAALAIDDFGTGYSSLSLLKELPLDAIKIDRAFIAGIARGGADTAIAEAMIGLAHTFGITAVAEGVEEAEQADVLRGLGCDRAQGFYFARPMESADLEDWLRARADRAS